MLRNRQIIFYILNLLIWIVTWLVFTAHDYIWFSETKINSTLFFTGAIFSYFTGFVVSCLLYYYLNKYFYKNHEVLSISKLLIVVIVSSELWIWLDFGITIIYANIKNVEYGLSIETFVVHRLRLAFFMLSWMGFYLTQKYWFDWLAQKEKTKSLALLAEEAQFKVLRYQLNPHFLFNSFNSLRALIFKSPYDAEKMLSKLSDFMRYSLTNKNEKEIPLEEEINVTKDYLEIEKVRYGDNLQLDIHIEPIATEYPIPPFLILPLVDNAVKYGMKTSKMPLHVYISAEVENEELHINVSNTGHWINYNNSFTGTGTGLENIKNRLKIFYNDNQSFAINNQNNKVSVEIKIKREITNEGTED